MVFIIIILYLERINGVALRSVDGTILKDFSSVVCRFNSRLGKSCTERSRNNIKLTNTQTTHRE